MLSATMHSVRLGNMTQAHQTVFYGLSTTVGKSVATIANALGLTADATEKLLGAIVDEGLASRTVGTRDSATYLAL